MREEMRRLELMNLSSAWLYTSSVVQEPIPCYNFELQSLV